MIEGYFDGVLTKFEYDYEGAPITIAYNSKSNSEGAIKRELFDIMIFFSGTTLDMDFNIIATNNIGQSYRSYSSADTIQKIRDNKISYDDWIQIAIVEEEIKKENDIVKEEESSSTTQEESVVKEESEIKENGEEDVLNQIMEQAKKDWPNDRDMQEFQYKNQVDVYHEILNLPNTSDYHEGILVDAQKDWTGDYEMQLFQYENQLDAYQEILNLPNTNDFNESALNRAKSDWPGDYEMQLWQYDNEK